MEYRDMAETTEALSDTVMKDSLEKEEDSDINGGGHKN